MKARTILLVLLSWMMTASAMAEERSTLFVNLADGSKAVGIFNLNDQPVPVNIAGALGKLGLAVPATVRDLWRQKNIPTDAEYLIPPHGVLYVKVLPSKQAEGR